MKVGVLAMQGAFAEHIAVLQTLGVDAFPLKNRRELDDIDGLIIPGGESTVMGKLLTAFGIKDDLRSRIRDGLPVWGTCAGMVLLAKTIVASNVKHLSVMNIQVVRNAYGRQLGSFAVNEKIEGIEGEPFPMVFIRAPYIESVGNDISILAKVNGRIVAARKKNILVTSFHPELTQDSRVHEYFIHMTTNIE